MNTCDDKKIFNKYKKRVESDLRNYPFWLIAIESKGLGYPTRWGGESKSKSISNSFLEDEALNDIEKERKVNCITEVLSKLDLSSKKIIEEGYFRDTYTREELQREMRLNKNKFYYFKNRALKKFMVALSYI
ncbi:nitroreductase [Clostridium novyi]|uniref:nitroreductase n=1 Tax=Clostridium novyi TaxID=1542 RepID=UPI000AA2B83C|nr:nitroreductase [Clostridium novyi]